MSTLVSITVGGAGQNDHTYDAGYASSSRFYDEADQVLGMTPSAYRAGGTATDIHFAIGQCTLGAILVAQTARGVCAILLGDDPEALLRELQDRFPKAHLIGGDASFERTVAQVVGFVEAPRIGWSLPLDLQGTAFQQRVWQALRAIPAGRTLSYSELAAAIGAPRAVRAAAQRRAAIAWPSSVVLAVPPSESCAQTYNCIYITYTYTHCVSFCYTGVTRVVCVTLRKCIEGVNAFVWDCCYTCVTKGWLVGVYMGTHIEINEKKVTRYELSGIMRHTGTGRVFSPHSNGLKHMC